jgi:triphosphoribosyl-dephospho-CoA synthase
MMFVAPYQQHSQLVPGRYLSLRGNEHIALKMSHIATTCLYQELALVPKPGLVSFIDSGSHQDMNAQTFLRSINSLSWYFKIITQAGALSYPFSELRILGILAEKHMLNSTGGINTHRGAIFFLGILCATAGMCYEKYRFIDHRVLRHELLLNWGEDLQEHARGDKGYTVGARQEAALGMPCLFEVGYPKLNECMMAKKSRQQALIETLMNLMACLYDTNIIRRSGHEGLHFVQKHSMNFINAGGTTQLFWREKLWALHQNFKEKNISPGGSADMLAASLFVNLSEKIKW